MHVGYKFLKLLFILHDDLINHNFVELSNNKLVYVVLVDGVEKNKDSTGRTTIKISDINKQINFAKCEIGIGIDESMSDIFILKHRRYNLGSTFLKSETIKFKSHIREIINNYKYDVSLHKYLGLEMEETLCERVANTLEIEMFEEGVWKIYNQNTNDTTF